MAKRLTPEALRTKQQAGTLSKAEEVDYLVLIRGMLRKDAQHLVDKRWQQEVQLDGSK